MTLFLRHSYSRMFNTLPGRILATVGFLLLAGMVVLFLAANWTGYRFITEVSHLRAHAVSEGGVHAFTLCAQNDNRDRIREHLETMVHSGQVTSAAVLDSTGRYLYAFPPGSASQNAVDLRTFTEIDRTGWHAYRFDSRGGELSELFATPLANSAKCRRCHEKAHTALGFLLVRISLDDIKQAAGQHRISNILLIATVFLVIGLVSALIFHRAVSRPLLALQQSMVHATSEIDRLADGEHISAPPPAVVHGEGEIASLARSFDVLVQRLNAAYDEILALHSRSMHKADQLATVGEMAAGMAHEIKNPVTGIRAALQVILRAESPDSEHYDIFREMLVQLDRIDAAVNDLLCYSREEPPDIREINLTMILEKTVLLVQPMLQELPVTIDLQCDTENDVIEADGKQLQQVMWNIIMNAVQAIPDRGTITIRTRLSGSLMEICVHDSGVGIPKDLQSIVFKPFYTSKHKGTGLGLTICSRIVQQHGGSITIDSSPGEGTTVCVKVPVRQTRRSAHAR